jgi:hypothetical protein
MAAGKASTAENAAVAAAETNGFFMMQSFFGE